MSKLKEALEPISEQVQARWIGDRAMPIRLNHLLSFIRHYQQGHSGVTPTVAAMSNEVGVTDQQIRFMLNMLEREGRIHRFGQNPIRIMVKDSPQPLETARRLAAAVKDRVLEGTAQERFDAVEAKRHEIVRAIGDFWMEHGRSPNLREIMADTQASGAWLNEQMNLLCRRGILERGVTPTPVKLTKEGRIVFGYKEEDFVMNTAKETPKMRPIERARQVNAEAYQRKLDAIVIFMREFARREGRAPTMSEVAVKFSPSPVAQNMKAPFNSLLKDGRLGKSDKGVFITDESGRQIGEATPPFQKSPRAWDGAQEKKEKKDKPKRAFVRSNFVYDRAVAIANAMHEYAKKFSACMPPKLIAKELGLGTHVVYSCLNGMAERGFVTHEYGRKSDYRLTEAGIDRLIGVQDKPSPEKEPETPAPADPAPDNDYLYKRRWQPEPQPAFSATVLPLQNKISTLEAVIAGLRSELEVARSAHQSAGMPDERDMIIALIERGYTVSKR